MGTVIAIHVCLHNHTISAVEDVQMLDELTHLCEISIAVRITGTVRFKFVDPLEEGMPVFSDA